MAAGTGEEHGEWESSVTSTSRLEHVVMDICSSTIECGFGSVSQVLVLDRKIPQVRFETSTISQIQCLMSVLALRVLIVPTPARQRYAPSIQPERQQEGTRVDQQLR
jgi:hypothetical protein